MNNSVSIKPFLYATLFCLISFGSIQLSNAQKGTFLISNHSPFVNNNLYFDLEISPSGNTYIASKNGVVKYNGNQYDIIDTGGAVLTLTTSTKNKLYVGGVGGFGYILKENFEEVYQPIVSNPNLAINDLLITTSTLYAISNNTLIKYDLKTNEFEEYHDELAGQFHHVFEFNNHVLLTTENKGILEIVNNILVTTDQSLLLDKEINFIVKSDYSSKYILGTYTHELFVFEDGNLKPILVDNDFLSKNISCAAWYDDDRIVLGSTYGGLAIISTSKQKVIEEINFDSGLIANDIKTISVDKNGNILSLSERLLELVALKVPINSFSHFDGLTGTPLAVSYFNNLLYISTDQGLYSLNKIDNYEQKKYVVPTFTTTRSELVEKQTKKKLFRKNRKKDNIKEEMVVQSSRVITKKTLTSSYFQFKEIENTHHGNQLISGDSMLLVSGLSGVYEIAANNASVITQLPAYYSYLSKNNSLIFICGDKQISTFYKKGNVWVEINILSDFSDNITHIIEYEDNFWLCGTNKIHKLTITSGELVDAEIFLLQNPYFDAVYGAIQKKSLHFFSINNHYSFVNDSLTQEMEYMSHQLTLDNNNNLWININGAWQTPDGKHNTPLFSAIDNIKYIYTDNKNPNFWILSEDKEILRFETEQNPEQNKYLPYLDKIITNNPTFISLNSFKIDQLNNTLGFEIAHPDLTKLQNTLYRHRLLGLSKEWSVWSKNHEIKYSFLPAGDYELEVESKSVFNQLYHLEPVTFSVIPPYWKQPLFYLFEFMVIVFLLIIAMKMRSLGARFQILSRILAFLVLAIILEGIQVIMESNFNLQSSPFFSFSLQVMTALILFPFEGFLRKYILLEKSSLFAKSYNKLTKRK